ncbi:MAG TPA: sugar ABC transporter permease [Firmicutes bacterium]|nr:sugar ABC transporter permease [Bacillota bacterium]
MLGQERSRSFTATAILFLLPAVAFYVVYMLLPIPMSFYYSLFKWDGISPTKVYSGLSNWDEMLHDTIFWGALRNNIVLVVLSILIQLPIGLILGVLLTSRIRFVKLFKTVYFIPMLLSSVAIGLLWKYIYDPTFGLLNSFLRLIGLQHLTTGWLGDPATALFSVIGTICWQYIPFYMILFMAAIVGIPDELYEAAKIDGASDLGCFRHVTLPLLRGTISMASILSLVGSLKYFDLIYVMTEGGPNHSTELMATYMYKKAFHSFEMGYGSAVAVAMFAISLIAAVAVMGVTQYDARAL